MIKYAGFVSLALHAFAFGQSVDAEQDRFIGSVPREVHSAMEDRGCSPIPGFYDRVVEAPPFLYVKKLLDGENALFFVCQFDAPTSVITEFGPNKKLVVMKQVRSKGRVKFVDFEDCPAEIQFGGSGSPGGLTIELDPDVSYLRGFEWESAERPFFSHPEDVDIVIENPPSWIINEVAEGVGTGSFCVKSKWYHLGYH